MGFKFERLEIWQRSIEYIDTVYDVAQAFPKEERFNLVSQIRRAATSIALNIAEGSTGQTDAEQARFLGMALRSLLETVACLHLARRRGYIADDGFQKAYADAQRLAVKIQAMRRHLAPDAPWVRDPDRPYDTFREDNE